MHIQTPDAVGCAENIPLKTDRRGSSAEVPAIAHLTAEAKTQAAEALAEENRS